MMSLGTSFAEVIPLPEGEVTEILAIPNSDWLVGVSSANGQKDLFVLNRITFAFHFLTENSWDEEQVSVSPDGDKIAFISHEKDSLGDVVVARLRLNQKPSLKIISHLNRPSTQEDSTSFSQSGLLFTSKGNLDKDSSLFLWSENRPVRRILEGAVTPISHPKGTIFFIRQGRIFYLEQDVAKPLFSQDGFLRRSIEVLPNQNLRYLRYSYDSNGDGLIDSNDSADLIEINHEAIGKAHIKEEVRAFKANQVAKFASSGHFIYSAERISSGFSMVRIGLDENSCDLSLAKDQESYESYISVCSEKDFGKKYALQWRYFIRNFSLSEKRAAMFIQDSDCDQQRCRFDELDKTYQLNLRMILKGKPSDIPSELVLDWALRKKLLTSEHAIKILDRVAVLSRFTARRLIGLISSENRIKNLEYFAKKSRDLVGYLAAVESSKIVAKTGGYDLALNQILSLIRRFRDRNLDVAEAIELAGRYSLAADLKGMLQLPLKEVLEHNALDPNRKKLVYSAAARALVIEGSNALNRGLLDQARQSFELALKFSPEDLRALKGLSQLGWDSEKHSRLAQIISESFNVEKISDLALRTNLLRKIASDLEYFSSQLFFDSEFQIFSGWVSYQLYLTDKLPPSSVTSWLGKRGHDIKKFLGFSSVDHLQKALDSLQRAASLERSQGDYSEGLAQNLAVVLFEARDYKRALRSALQRISFLKSQEFPDAEIGAFFIGLASAAAGKIDEYELAIQLAQSAEGLAEKSNLNNLLKLKRGKVYLLFQNGQTEKAAREITQVITLGQWEQLELARLKVLRAWFYKLSGRRSLALSSLDSISQGELSQLESGNLNSHYRLYQWMRRDLAQLPKDENVFLKAMNDDGIQGSFLQRTFDRLAGNNHSFSDRAKLSLDSARRFLRAGYRSQALMVVDNASNDIRYLAKDIDNREAPIILGNWLDMKIVLSLDQVGEVDRLSQELLKISSQSCQNTAHSQKSQNCLDMIDAISSRIGVRNPIYAGSLKSHAARNFLWTRPEDVSFFVENEMTRSGAPTSWLRLISTGSVADGLLLWSKGVLAGELKDYDLEEIEGFYDRLDSDQKQKLDVSSYRFARTIRLREKMGLDGESLRRYFVDLKAPSPYRFEADRAFGLFSGQSFERGMIILDPFADRPQLSKDNVMYPLSNPEYLTYAPLVYKYQKENLTEFLNKIKKYKEVLRPQDPNPEKTDLDRSSAEEGSKQASELPSELSIGLPIGLSSARADLSDEKFKNSKVVSINGALRGASTDAMPFQSLKPRSQKSSPFLIGASTSSQNKQPGPRLSMDRGMTSDTLTQSNQTPIRNESSSGQNSKITKAHETAGKPNVAAVETDSQFGEKLGKALMICGWDGRNGTREMDEIFAVSWDLFQGRVFVSSECESSLLGKSFDGKSSEGKSFDEGYFDSIDDQSKATDFFEAWNIGLGRRPVAHWEISQWDSFVEELVSRADFLGAYLVYDVMRILDPNDRITWQNGMATSAFFDKKWENARQNIDELLEFANIKQSSTEVTNGKKDSENHLKIANSTAKTIDWFEVMRKRAVLEENISARKEVESRWEAFIEASKASNKNELVLKGMNSLGNYLLDKASDFMAAQKVFQKSVEWSSERSLDNFDGQFGLAMVHMRTNSFLSALESLTNLEKKVPESSNPLMRLRLHQQISSALFGLGNLSTALKKLAESSQLIGLLNSPVQKSRYEIMKLNLEAMIYARQGWYEKSGAVFEKAITLSEKAKMVDLRSILLANQGFWQRVRGHADGSLGLYKQAMALSAAHDLPAKASDLRNLGLAYLAGGRSALAEASLLESEELSLRFNLKQNLGLSKLGLAQIYFERRSFQEAFIKTSEAAEIFREQSLLENYTRALYGKSLVLWSMGQKKEAQNAMDRAILLNFKSSPGQRLGHGKHSGWIDLTMRDIFDDWLEKFGSTDPKMTLGLITFWHRRQTIDRLLTVDSVFSRLLDQSSAFMTQHFRNPETFNLKENDVSTELQEISSHSLVTLPQNTIVLWSLRSSVLSILFSAQSQALGLPEGNQETSKFQNEFSPEGIRYRSGTNPSLNVDHQKSIDIKQLPIDRRLLLRYRDFSESLFDNQGDTTLFTQIWFRDLMNPHLSVLKTSSVAFLTSDEFDEFPLEMLAHSSTADNDSRINIRRLLGGLDLEEDDKADPWRGKGFWGGSQFGNYPNLNLVQEEADMFKRLLGGTVVLNTDMLRRKFEFMQISGHFFVDQLGSPRLSLGKKNNFGPEEILENLPPAKNLFLNFCGLSEASALIRSIAALNGARKIIDASGKLSDISAFAMSKELLPRLASGQDFNEALTDAQVIISQTGKHPSYWARFRQWDIF